MAISTGEIDVEDPTSRHGRVSRTRVSRPQAQNHLRQEQPQRFNYTGDPSQQTSSGDYALIDSTGLGATTNPSGNYQSSTYIGDADPDDADWEGQGGGQRSGCRTCYYLGEMFVCCDCRHYCQPWRCCNRCVVGPSWVNLFFFYLIIAGISFATLDSWNMMVDQGLRSTLMPLVIGASCVNCLSLVLLSLLAFSDPGILPKHTTAKAPDWTYSMQGLSYRPPGAIFCKKTKVIVEDYDHFCGMSGTVVGKNNILYFRSFVVALLSALTLDAVLLVLCLNS